MLSKRQNQLLLVRVKLTGKMSFVIPLPFLVLNIYARALADLSLLGQLILPLWVKGKGPGNDKRWLSGIRLTVVGDIVKDLLQILRRHGHWRLVEVKTPDVEVYIDLF